MRSGRRTTCPPGGKASQTNQACQCRPPLPGDGLARSAVVSQEIANRPKVEFPHEAKVNLSHETIYQCPSSFRGVVSSKESLRGACVR